MSARPVARSISPSSTHSSTSRGGASGSKIRPLRRSRVNRRSRRSGSLRSLTALRSRSHSSARAGRRGGASLPAPVVRGAPDTSDAASRLSRSGGAPPTTANAGSDAVRRLAPARKGRATRRIAWRPSGHRPAHARAPAERRGAGKSWSRRRDHGGGAKTRFRNGGKKPFRRSCSQARASHVRGGNRRFPARRDDDGHPPLPRGILRVRCLGTPAAATLTPSRNRV